MVEKETLLSNVLQKGNRKWVRLVGGGERTYQNKPCFLLVAAHTFVLSVRVSHCSSAPAYSNISDSISGSLDNHHCISYFLCFPWRFFLSLFLLLLSVLILQRSPAHSILFALGAGQTMSLFDSKDI